MHDVNALRSTILWLKYSKLEPEVQGQLEAPATRGARREDVDQYLLVIELEPKEAEEALLRHGTWSRKLAFLRRRLVATKQPLDS